MGWLDGKVALVTGGGSGLGRALVERYLEEGAKVAVLDKSETLLANLRQEFGGRIHTTLGNVQLLEDNYRAVAEAVSTFGGLDIFVGNAGIWDWRIKLVDIPDDKIDAAFDEIMGVNVKGYLFGVKAALPELVKSKGTVILTVSNAGYYVDGGGPLYTASKHAVVGLIRQLAHELAPVIRVNGVAPGALATDLRGAASLGQNEQSLASVPFADICKDLYPLRRLPIAREYTGAYVLLASSENSGSTTGVVINCDGGIGVRGFMSAAGGDDLPQRLNLSE
jgi:cis-2,3-dihydrobiphenyl-2,3-diol dehydrogenase